VPVLLLAAAFAEASPPPPAPRPPAPPPRAPVLVMVEADPWRMVIGSDSPTFALYDDGLLIHARAVAGGRSEPASVVLDAEAMKALLAAAFPDRKAYAALKPHHDLSEATDQPTTTIHDWFDGARRSRAVYGVLRPREGHDRAKAPAAFRTAFDALVGYAHPAAKAWLPEKVEVMVWGFEYAKGDPVEWPKDWPGLDDATTRRRGDDYSIYLDPKHLARLRALLEGLDPRRPVVIGGKKWAIAWRFPFPAEERWMR
jgi:hypothetical protein